MERKLRAAGMRKVNPALIPRNHRIEQVIRAAVDDGDFGAFETLSDALSQPYLHQERFSAYAEAPLPGERVLQTFCGT